MALDPSDSSHTDHLNTDKGSPDHKDRQSSLNGELAHRILLDTLDEAGLDAEIAEAEIGYDEENIHISVGPSESFKEYLVAMEDNEDIAEERVYGQEFSTDPEDYLLETHYAFDEIDDLRGTMDDQDKYDAVVNNFRIELWNPDERLNYEDWTI